jgi:hypothetical protein
MASTFTPHSEARSYDVAAALRSVGYEPMGADRAWDRVGLSAAVRRQPLDCFVQTETGTRVIVIAPTEDHRLAPPEPVPSYVDFEPGLGFADWRHELLSLVEPTGWASDAGGTV